MLIERVFAADPAIISSLAKDMETYHSTAEPNPDPTFSLTYDPAMSFSSGKLALPYGECVELWSKMITEDGKFTEEGLVAAGKIESSDGTPILRDRIAHKYDLDTADAAAAVGNAMWDILTIRGLRQRASSNFGTLDY